MDLDIHGTTFVSESCSSLIWRRERHFCIRNFTLKIVVYRVKRRKWWASWISCCYWVLIWIPQIRCRRWLILCTDETWYQIVVFLRYRSLFQLCFPDLSSVPLSSILHADTVRFEKNDKLTMIIRIQNTWIRNLYYFLNKCTDIPLLIEIKISKIRKTIGFCF